MYKDNMEGKRVAGHLRYRLKYLSLCSQKAKKDRQCTYNATMGKFVQTLLQRKSNKYKGRFTYSMPFPCHAVPLRV